MSPKEKNRIKRFTPVQRIFHLLLMLSFLIQGATGLSRMYMETPWGRSLSWVFGGYESAIKVHTYVGIFMLCGFLVHILYLFSRIRWRRFPLSLFDPDSLLPRPDDIIQGLQHVCWMIGLERLVRLDRWGYLKKFDDLLVRITRLPPLSRVSYFKDFDGLISMMTKTPRFDRWGYWEKFDYLGVCWGIPVLGITGLALAYPLISTRFMPGWGLNLALWIHRIEAILAMGHVFIIHFFIGHLRRHSFPMDRAMFEGSVDLEATRHEKPAWVARLEEKGMLESQLVPTKSAGLRALFYIYGYFAMAVGVYLLIGALISTPYVTW